MTISNKAWDRLNIAFWLCVAVAVYLYCSGFCFSEFRYFDDKDFISRAIHYNADSMGIEDSPEAVQAFLKANPDCCAVDRTSHTTGFRTVEVELNYKERGVDDKGRERYYRKYVKITSGGSRGKMYGESTDALKRPGQL